MKLRTTAGMAAALAVTTAAGLIVASSGATSAAQATRSSAFGLAVYAQGDEAVPPTPYIESTDGSTQTTGGGIPDNPLLSGAVAQLSAGNNQASVNLTDLVIGSAAEGLPQELKEGLSQLQAGCAALEQSPGELPPIFEQLPIPGLETPTNDELIAFCNGLLDGVVPNLLEVGVLDIACGGDAGRVTVTDLSALGAPLPDIAGDVPPNTKVLPDNPLISITLNRQTAGPNGGFTVDGLVIDLGEGQGEVIAGSTTCGEVLPTSKPDPKPNPDPAPAPIPTPVPQPVPVTG